MGPFLRPGSHIEVEWFARASDANPLIGDLVLCRSSAGTWIFHRLLGKDAQDESRWVVKGDAGFLSETFEAGEIWGRAVSIRAPSGGKPVPFRRNFLDRLIARVSFSSLRHGGLSARVLRKTTKALGWLRRWL